MKSAKVTKKYGFTPLEKAVDRKKYSLTGFTPPEKTVDIKQHSLTGFTLVELIMVIVIVGALAGGAAIFVNSAVKVWNLITFRNDEVVSARLALDRMVREMRELVATDGIYNDTNSTRFHFQHISGDIAYSRSGNNLMRNSDTLATGISSLGFTYYNVNGTLTTTPSQVRRVNIGMTITSGSESLSVNSQVYPRIYFNGE